MREEILHTERLTIQGAVHTAEDIDLLLREGECLVLAGLNNSAVEEVCALFGGRGAVAKGRVYLCGRPLANLQHQTMWDNGAYFIEPEPPVIMSATLAEMLFLFRGGRQWRGRVNYDMMHRQADALFVRYGLPFSAGQMAVSLSRADQALFSLLWAASQGARLMVLYDLEKNLAPAEVERLVELMLRMKAEGIAFLVGTSHARAYFPAADQVVVMRHSRICRKLYDPAQFPLCYQVMRPGLTKAPRAPGGSADAPGPVCLRYENLYAGPERTFDLELRRGEAAALTTPDSAWQKPLWQDLTFSGGRRPALWLDGAHASCRSVDALVRRRVGVWAGGIDDNQLLENLSCGENLLLPALKRISRGGMYTRRAGHVLQDRSFFGQAVSLREPLPAERKERLQQAVLRVPAPVVTLSLQLMIVGLSNALLGWQNLYQSWYPLGMEERGFWFLALAVLLPLAVLAAWLLGRTYWGRMCMLVGENRAQLERAGIHCGGAIAAAHVLAGVFFALAAVLLVARTNSAGVASGQAYLYRGIMALSLSGVSLLGGRGSVSNALFGALAMVLAGQLITGTSWLGRMENLIQGGIILTALWGMGLERERQKRRIRS